MIILTYAKVKKNMHEIINNYRNIDEILPFLVCPHCNSDNFVKNGTYNRIISFISNKAITHKTIKVQRVKCKSCGHTHALLPSFIIPYKLNMLDVILSSINDEDIALSISFDTIVKWKKEFNKILPYLKTMFNNISKSSIIIKLKENILAYYEQYYKVNKKIMMMGHAGIYNMAYF